MSLIQKHKVLAYRRNKYEKSRSIAVADLYIAELEGYIPNEIIDEYAYSELFRKVLSITKETFRPDHFNSIITGELIHWLDFYFMEWLISHQNELKRRLKWNQVCELQCNWMGWNLIRILIPDFPEKTIREMWHYSDEQQKLDLYERLWQT